MDTFVVFKLNSAGLTYHLPKLSFFFTDPYCAGVGVSNKHCSLTFFSFLLLGVINVLGSLNIRLG